MEMRITLSKRVTAKRESDDPATDGILTRVLSLMDEKILSGGVKA
jgi:hypothetical protein